MKASQVYRRAAEIMDGNRCFFYGSALDLAGQPFPGGDHSPLQDKFCNLFDDCEQGWRIGKFHDETVLALLFMSEIAKDKERQ